MKIKGLINRVIKSKKGPKKAKAKASPNGKEATKENCP